MNMTTIQVGQTVKHVIADRWSIGRIGEVVEIDTEKQRARVYWTQQGNAKLSHFEPKRTWVKISTLAIAS